MSIAPALLAAYVVAKAPAAHPRKEHPMTHTETRPDSINGPRIGATVG